MSESITIMHGNTPLEVEKLYQEVYRIDETMKLFNIGQI